MHIPDFTGQRARSMQAAERLYQTAVALALIGVAVWALL